MSSGNLIGLFNSYKKSSLPDLTKPIVNKHLKKILAHHTAEPANEEFLKMTTKHVPADEEFLQMTTKHVKKHTFMKDTLSLSQKSTHSKLSPTIITQK